MIKDKDKIICFDEVLFKNGTNKAEIADKLEMSPQNLYKHLNRTEKALDILKRVSDALNIPITDFFSPAGYSPDFPLFVSKNEDSERIIYRLREIVSTNENLDLTIVFEGKTKKLTNIDIIQLKDIFDFMKK